MNGETLGTSARAKRNRAGSGSAQMMICGVVMAHGAQHELQIPVGKHQRISARCRPCGSQIPFSYPVAGGEYIAKRLRACLPVGNRDQVTVRPVGIRARTPDVLRLTPSIGSQVPSRRWDRCTVDKAVLTEKKKKQVSQNVSVDSYTVARFDGLTAEPTADYTDHHVTVIQF